MLTRLTSEARSRTARASVAGGRFSRRSNPSGQHVGALLALVAICFVAGCSATTMRPGDTSRDAAYGSLSPAAFTFIANAGLTNEELEIVGEAESALVARCMRAAGFRYQQASGGPDEAWIADVSLYTFSGRPPNEARSLATRASHGYGIAETSQENTITLGASQFDRTYFSHLTLAEKSKYLARLDGGSGDVSTSTVVDGTQVSYQPSGCHAAARASVFGNTVRSDWLNNFGAQMFGRASQAAATDSSVTNRMGIWVHCMRVVTGHRYMQPNGPIDGVERSYAEHGVNAGTVTLERRTAVADDRCQYASGVAAAYSHAFLDAVWTLPRADIVRAEEADQEIAAAVRRARAIIAHLRVELTVR